MCPFPRRLHQRREGSHRSPIRATMAPTSSQGSADGVVAQAEDVVRDAWLRALHGECEQTSAEMQTASARCDAARRNLAAALLGRDPGAIAVAYADLEGRLVGARIAMRAYRQARETLDWQLSVTYRQADEHVGRGWTLGKPDETASGRRRRRTVRALLALGWLSQRVVSSLVHLTAGLAAGRRL